MPLRGMDQASFLRFDPAVPLQRWPDYPEEEIASGTRSCCGHFYVEDQRLGLSAGVWEAEANETHWLAYPVHEFMIILEGEVTLFESSRKTTITAGESFVIPRGLYCKWSQKGRVRKFFVILEDSTDLPGNPGQQVIKINPHAPLAPVDPPSLSVLLSPVPRQNGMEAYTALDGRFSVGVWDTTGYARKLINFPRHELMHIIEGSVTLTDARGDKHVFKAGDTFFIPLGAPNAWSCDGYLRKIYCILMPPNP